MKASGASRLEGFEGLRLRGLQASRLEGFKTHDRRTGTYEYESLSDVKLKPLNRMLLCPRKNTQRLARVSKSCEHFAIIFRSVLVDVFNAIQSKRIEGRATFRSCGRSSNKPSKARRVYRSVTRGARGRRVSHAPREGALLRESVAGNQNESCPFSQRAPTPVQRPPW